MDNKIEKQQYILIIGDSGTGKTSFCERLKGN